MKTVQQQQCDSAQDMEFAANLSSAQLRKINKPIVEKKRRERINACLDELKDLLLETAPTTKQENHSKLEKADILEMTVRHLKNIKQSHRYSPYPTSSSAPAAAAAAACGAPADPSSPAYRDGYSDCAREVAVYLGRLDALNPVVQTRVLSHLSSRLRSVNALPPSLSSAGRCMSAAGGISTTLNPMPHHQLTRPAVLAMPTTAPSSSSSTATSFPIGDRFDAQRQYGCNATTSATAAMTSRMYESSAATPRLDWSASAAFVRPTSGLGGRLHHHHLAATDLVGKQEVYDEAEGEYEKEDDIDTHLSSTTRTVTPNQHEMPTSSSSAYDVNGNNIGYHGSDDDRSDDGEHVEVAAQQDDVWRPW